MYQKILIFGKLAKDPETRFTPSGKQVTNFSIPTHRIFSNGNGEKVKETVWFRVSAWGRQAETCHEFLKKGSLVLVEGRMIPDPTTGGPRIWNRQDGSPGASFELNAGSVQFLAFYGNGAPEEYVAVPDIDEITDDDIPF